MPEYIDREEAIIELERKKEFLVGSKYVSVDALIEFIRNRPKADVERVAHGTWIARYDGAYMRRRCYCSKCGKHNGIGGIAKNQEKPYCPNCGAKMDLE